jgi:hypothetical protein
MKELNIEGEVVTKLDVSQMSLMEVIFHSESHSLITSLIKYILEIEVSLHQKLRPFQL